MQPTLNTNLYFLDGRCVVTRRPLKSRRFPPYSWHVCSRHTGKIEAAWREKPVNVFVNDIGDCLAISIADVDEFDSLPSPVSSALSGCELLCNPASCCHWGGAVTASLLTSSTPVSAPPTNAKQHHQAHYHTQKELKQSTSI